MRRVIALVLAGLGAFLIVIAVVLPTYIVGQVTKFPLNEFETVTLTATNASYFSATKLTQITGANLQATYTIKGSATVGDATTAVWNEFSYVYDTTNHQEVESASRTFAFDRKTAELVNCCGASVNGNASIVQSGVVGYVFPINTQPKTYDVFDATLNQAVPFAYSGTDSVLGIKTYKFTENVTPRKIGFSPLSATEPEYYSIHLVYWVDPETGVLLKVDEQQNQYLVNAITNATVSTLFNAELVTTPATVRNIVALDNSGRNELTLLRLILPLVFGIVGALALAIGFWLYRQLEQVQPGLAPAPFGSPDATTPLVPGMGRGQRPAATEGERMEAP